MIKIDCTVQASDSWDQQSKPYFSFKSGQLSTPGGALPTVIFTALNTPS